MMTKSNRPVGITKGPGETIHEYTFISRDDQRLLKNGEYVYYQLESSVDNPGLILPESTDPRCVLGRIQQRVPVQLYPDTFLSEPEVSPSQVAALVGYDQRSSDLFELHVSILGYYDGELGTFVNPWIPPSSGTPIYLADDSLLAGVLSRKQSGATGSATIGSLLTRDEGCVPVVLDVKELVSTHLAIIASTGAGKSYLASVVIEELMSPYNRAAVLIIDPHGEYNTLQEIANHEEFGERGDGSRDAEKHPPTHRSRYHARARVYLHDQ